MWNDIMGVAADALPDFNDDLLVNFRRNKIAEIPAYLDETLFKETVKLFNGALEYQGYVVLSPDERIKYMMETSKSAEIQFSSLSLLRYDFKFENVIYSIHVHVPYMDRYALILSDTKYYPLFSIVERGGIHRSRDKVIIKVLRAPLTFWRHLEYVLTTTDQRTYRVLVITAKIHQRSSSSKKLEKTPLLLYHLATFGLPKTLEMYGFKPGDLEFVTEAKDDDTYTHIQIRDGLFMKLHRDVLLDVYRPRVIASLMLIWEMHNRFEVADLLQPSAAYFKVALGKYTYPSSKVDMLLYNNAEEHLMMCKTLLDATAQRQLHVAGIQAKDFNELMFRAFYDIDHWVLSYRPTDLYDKKIGSLDQLMAGLVRDITTKQLSTLNKSKKTGLTPQSISQMMRSSSRRPGWFNTSSMLRPNPTIYADNWLLAIGAKRFRSLENTEVKITDRNKKGKKIPISVLLAHPSHLVVEAISAIPPSNPCITGTINCYITTDSDGNIIRPDYADLVEHVYDRKAYTPESS